MLKEPKYYRARIDKIDELISYYNHLLKQSTITDDKEYFEKNLRVLRNGVFPEEENETELINNKLKQYNYSNSPLQFEEITKYNTWFNIYPNKVAGQEKITSSREFPITITGTKQDILNTINNTQKNDSFSFQLKLKQKLAKAKLLLLK